MRSSTDSGEPSPCAAAGVETQRAAAGAKRDIVFAGAALVGVAFDREGVVAVLLEPLRLLVEGAARLHRELGRIRLKEHAVADIDDKVLLTAWRGHAGCCKRVGRLV